MIRFLVHPIAGVADLAAYRDPRRAPRVSLRTPIEARYLADWSDDDMPPPAAPALPALHA